MKKTLALLLLFPICLGLTGCDSHSLDGHHFEKEEVMSFYEGTGIGVYHFDDITSKDEFDYDHYFVIERGQEKAFCYLFATNQKAVEFEKKERWDLLKYLMSALMGKAIWVESKVVGNLALTYENYDLVRPILG